MFRALLRPSPEAQDYSADYHMGRPVLLLVGSYPACLNLTSNQQQNRTAHVVISTIVLSFW